MERLLGRIFKLIFICLFLLLPSGYAQIAFVGSGDLMDNGGGSNTWTNSYTPGSGSNRLLIVFFLGDLTSGTDDCSGGGNGVTYNGIAMTFIGKTTTGAARFTYLYFLLNPDTGTHDVVITCGSTHYILAVAADYSGVRQSAQPDAHTVNVSANANDGTLTTSITTVASNAWIILGEESQTSAPTAGAGAIRRVFDGGFNTPALFDSNGPLASPGSHSMTTNQATPTIYFIVHNMASFAPDTSPPPAATGNGLLSQQTAP